MPFLPQTAIDDKTGATFNVASNPALNTITLTIPDANGNPTSYSFTLSQATLAQAVQDIVAYFPHSAEALAYAAAQAASGAGTGTGP